MSTYIWSHATPSGESNVNVLPSSLRTLTAPSYTIWASRSEIVRRMVHSEAALSLTAWHRAGRPSMVFGKVSAVTPAFSRIAVLSSSTLRPWYHGNWKLTPSISCSFQRPGK
jgi:hypothetical protein